MWRETGALKFESPAHKRGFRQIATRGFLINILNPKLSIFFLAFLPLFVSGSAASPIFQMILLAMVFMTMTLLIFILYGISANGVRRYVGHSPRTIQWVRRSFATIFALLGVRLALTDQ